MESLGQVEFFARHPQLRPPLVLAPPTAHYSWPKALKLVGLGTDHYISITQKQWRLGLDALEDALTTARACRQPVLMVVAMLGTTEFGGIDPIDGVVQARQRHAAEGFGFAVHVDAAWGGYLTTLFRNGDGTLRSRESVAAGCKYFATPRNYAAIAALSQTYSITIDPHKLGYMPYGAGAFVCRDHRPMSLLAIQADYVFALDPPQDYLSRYRQLGRYIPEGSKPGAMAAAVYVTHRVLPLDHDHFGRLPAQSLRAVEVFISRAQQFIAECANRVHACLPFMPDSNLVCIAFNARGNSMLDAANDFVRRLHDEMRIDPGAPLQIREFFGSMTSLRFDMLDPDIVPGLLEQLHLAVPESEWASARLLVLRHTIMNPFMLDGQSGVSYIDRYFEFLSRRIDALLPAAPNARAGESGRG